MLRGNNSLTTPNVEVGLKIERSELKCPMKQFVVALCLVLLAGADRTRAADFPLPSQAAPSPPPLYGTAPYPKWGGLYVGVNGGYGLGGSQWNLAGLPSGVFDANGFLFGGTLGFNVPISEILVGLEGDVDWSGLNGSVGNCALNAGGAVASCETKSNWLGTARARAGYEFDRTLIYVTGGAAFGNVQSGLSPGASFDAATRIGWTAGAGLEFALSDSWSAKAEYLFVNFSNASCTSVANCGTAAGSSVALTESLVRAGINYRFSW
jgi:outer membrane immunogenic protein